MRWLRGETPDSSFERLRNAIQASSLKTRLMIGLIPPVVLIMMITGYVTYYIQAIHRKRHPAHQPAADGGGAQ